MDFINRPDKLPWPEVSTPGDQPRAPWSACCSLPRMDIRYTKMLQVDQDVDPPSPRGSRSGLEAAGTASSERQVCFAQGWADKSLLERWPKTEPPVYLEAVITGLPSIPWAGTWCRCLPQPWSFILILSLLGPTQQQTIVGAIYII